MEEFSEELSEETEDENEKKVVSVYYEAPPEDTEVIGVRFRSSGKVYYFDPDGKKYPEGCHAVVETARGTEYGCVSKGNHIVSGREIVLPLRKALRIATPEDDCHNRENLEKAEEAFLIGNKKIEEHGLDMKLIDTEYTFDNTKLLFYFTSDGRVDFRELVKDLASVFHCRIELRQMGIRDEAKVLGGLGSCGRPFCCHAFLLDFVQVSIKMAKEQNLSLNSVKISGACGRLMCCLRYEYDTYLEEGRLTPKVDSLVNTPDGIGVVVEAKPLVGLVKVKSLDDSAGAPKVYHRDMLSPIKKGDDNYEKALEEKTLERQAKAAGITRAALKAAASGEVPEKKEEKPKHPVRPAPKRAASYTGQVLPSALERNAAVAVKEENAVPAEEQVVPNKQSEDAKGEIRRSRRNQNKGKNVVPLVELRENEHKNDKKFRKNNQVPHKNVTERSENTVEKGNTGKTAEPPVKANTTERQPRYEKFPRPEREGAQAQGRHILPKREQYGSDEEYGEYLPDKTSVKKKNRHPFRPFHRRSGGNKGGENKD